MQEKTVPNAHNYTTRAEGRTITAAELILRLDPACGVQHAHIGEIWRVCKSGINYSGEDGDVLSAAAAELWKGPRDPCDFEAAWVARWLNSPAHIADAICWAKANAPAQPRDPLLRAAADQERG